MTLKVGDRLIVQVTGVVGNLNAEVVQTEDVRGSLPYLKIVNENGTDRVGWLGITLKEGDYIRVSA